MLRLLIENQENDFLYFSKQDDRKHEDGKESEEIKHKHEKKDHDKHNEYNEYPEDNPNRSDHKQ